MPPGLRDFLFRELFAVRRYLGRRESRPYLTRGRVPRFAPPIVAQNGATSLLDSSLVAHYE